MTRRFGDRPAALLTGFLTLVAWAMAALLLPSAWYDVVHENAFDVVLALDQHMRSFKTAAPRASRVIVVDVDHQTLERLGPWPWPRETTARLVEAVAAAHPSVIAVDIMFSGADNRSPAALARNLGALTDKPEIAALAETLPDGDRHLATIMADQRVVLGFLLDVTQSSGVPGVPILAQGAVELENVWQAPGAVVPPDQLSDVAAAIGTLSLPGDADGRIRRVPLLVGIGDTLRPGLSAEIARLSQNASTFLIQSGPQRLTTGNLQIPLPPDGFLRLVPVSLQRQEVRTISAADLFAGKADIPRLADAIVVIGGSAPELGGLRPTPTNPLTSSAEIHAGAIEQILENRIPLAVAGIYDVLMIAAVGMMAAVAAATLAPLLSLVVMTTATVATWAGSFALSILDDRLLDPLVPSVCALTVFVATSIFAYASTRKREALVRQRFEQHLSPAVVKRIVEHPELLKLNGERREVTALFTDVQNFTAMTHRADPQDLVAILDAYIEGVTDLVIAHGGMVDKVVGDAVHALFNVPIDLQDHARRAVACAIALRAWTHDFVSRPDARALGFERTRIGVETGMAIVGDIGIRNKLDYTAHGDAVNAAARFEAANKTLGSTICLGPVVASRVDPAIIRPLGTIAVQGRDDLISVYEPWPVGMTAELRERYLAALRMRDENPVLAALQFQAMAAEFPNDRVLVLMAERLRWLQAIPVAQE